MFIPFNVGGSGDDLRLSIYSIIVLKKSVDYEEKIIESIKDSIEITDRRLTRFLNNKTDLSAGECLAINQILLNLKYKE